MTENLLKGCQSVDYMNLLLMREKIDLAVVSQKGTF